MKSESIVVAALTGLPLARPLRRVRLLLAVGSLLSGLALPAAAPAASIPLLPAGGGAATAASAKSGAAGEEIQSLLESARREAAQVEQSPNYAANAPATVREDELKLRRYYLRETVRSYENLLRNLKQQAELRLQLEDAKRAAETWTALDSPPPYSVVLVDGLSQEASSARLRLKSLNSRQDLVGELRDSISSSAKASAASVRLLEEQLANAPEDRKAGVAWSLEMARQRLRAQSAIMRSLEVSDENNQLSIAIAQQEAALAERKLDSVTGKVAFSATDRTRIETDLAGESNAVSERLTRAMDNATAAAERLDLARQALQQAQASRVAEQAAPGAQPVAGAPGARASSLDILRQDVTLAEQRLHTANIVLDALRYAPGLLEMKRSLWDYRYRLYREKNPPELLAEAKQRLSGYSTALALIIKINERQMATALSETMALEKQLASADAAIDAPLIQWQLADLAAREDQLRFVSAFASSVRTLMSTVEGELGGRVASASLAERLSGSLIEVTALARGLWNYELFVAEDTIEVDGKKVTGYSSITVGKVLRAILIFSVGVLVSLWLARLSEAFVVRRFNYDAARARILRKWFYTLSLLILLVLVLTWVNIPLTVFAFLGGAIAIGLGFGMQNVLKNLISGLMLLFERPFQPGDLVEVGPLKGNITEIGIRSSTIRDVNGVDTLIPNSLFVEQSVTNWTYDSPRVRFCVRVGVAYGSPESEVAELLADCVRRHGLVLTDPEPEILFENFGADSLEFGIYFWLELGPKVTGRRVSSDLRFIIAKTLAEHGIVISYPQRDVHLDAAAPLKVEIVGPAAG